MNCSIFKHGNLSLTYEILMYSVYFLTIEHTFMSAIAVLLFGSPVSLLLKSRLCCQLNLVGKHFPQPISLRVLLNKSLQRKIYLHAQYMEHPWPVISYFVLSLSDVFITTSS